MTNAATHVRIVIVDDHALFRESIARLLNAEADFEVVADCASMNDALSILSSTLVDLVLLDFDLGEENGFTFLPKARRAGFQGKVLIVTAGLSDFEGAELVHQGVVGIFMKHSSAAALSEGIRHVMSGKVWFERRYLTTIFETPPTGTDTRLRAQRLSERERQVLHHILEGLSNKQIAERLETSESSVKASLQRIFDKARVRTRSQLVRVALERYKDQV